jgi:hypothetical protein
MPGMQSPEPVSAATVYVNAVHASLAQRGFIFQTGPGGVLVAHRSSLEITKFGNLDRVVILMYRPTLEPAEFAAFSAWAFDYSPQAIRDSRLPRGFGQTVFCYAVAAVDVASPQLIAAASRSAPRHWAGLETRVVRDLTCCTTYSLQKKLIWGAAYSGSERAFVRSTFG